MKNPLFLLCLFLLIGVSCISVKSTKKTNFSNENFFVPLDSVSVSKKMKGYTITIPENWYSYIESHGLFWQSPKELKKKGVIYYANHFSVKTEEVKEDTDVEKVYKKRKKWLRKVCKDFSISKKLFKHKTYGDYLVVNYDHTWHGIKYTASEVIYLYKDKSYVLQYSSWNQYYKKYLPGVLVMMDSFTIN